MKFLKMGASGGCLVGLAGLLFAAPWSSAWAANGAQSTKEEIVITTRKRAENPQDVPVAVGVFDDTSIDKLNINGISDVGKYSPSLIFDQGFAAQDVRITIRGLAPTRGRQNAAVLVDGIDVTGLAVMSNGGSLLINPRLFDLERIEVVKGPQNALYGRTAFAGAINYITRKPSDDLTAQVYTDLGDNSRYDVRGSVSGPLVPGVLLGGMSAAVWTDDGHRSNSVTGGDIGGAEGWGWSGSLLWNISERFSANARVEYTDDELDQSAYTNITPTVMVGLPASALGSVIAPSVASLESVRGTMPDGDSLAVTLSEDPRTGADYPGVEREILRASLILDYDFGPVSLVSLTGYTDGDTFSFEDARREGSVSAAGKTTGGEFWADEQTEVISQELRLQSNSDGALNWTVGALYWEENVDFLDGSLNCIANSLFSPFPPPGGIVPGANCGAPIAAITDAMRFADPWERDSEHWSVYGLVDWEFVENFSVVFEARYSDEKITVTGPDRTSGGDRSRAIDPRGILFGTALQPSFGNITDSVDDDFFAPKVTLQWEPTDDSLYYLSWAQSYKPKGIAIVGALSGFNPQGSKFDQEELQVWELGAKTSWLDNRVVLNGALFYQDFSDKQVSSQRLDPATGLLFAAPVNAASAEIYGLELDASWQVTEGLEIYAQYTYLDSEYEDYKQLSKGPAPIADAGNCTVVPPTPPETDTFCEIDLSGRDLEYVPEHSLLAGVEYRQQFGSSMEWFAGMNYIYQDERYTSSFNIVSFDSYSLFDFRAGVGGENWEVQGYVDNAFDDDTIKSSFGNTYNQGLRVAAPPFTFVLPLNQTPILPDGREVGVRARYRFGT